MPENGDSAAAATEAIPPNGCGYAPRKVRVAKNSSQKIDKNKSNIVNESSESSAQVLDTSVTSSGSSSSAIKTPVSILQELLSRRCITPSYELVQIEGISFID